MNTSVIGIAIASGGSTVGEVDNGLPTGGNSADWSSSGDFVFDAAHVDGGIFRSNSNSGGGIPGAIQWIGMKTSGLNQLGDVITLDGATIGGLGNVAQTFENGFYDTFLINGFTGRPGTSAGTIVPEPAAFSLYAIALCGLAVFRRQR